MTDEKLSIELLTLSSEHIDRVVYLLENGADVNYVGKSPNDLTPLHRAAARLDYLLAEVLLANGADPNLKVGKKNALYCVLHSVSKNPLPMIALLLANGADPTEGLHQLLSVCHYHWEYSLRILDMLFAAGADPNLPIGNGNNALMATTSYYTFYGFAIRHLLRPLIERCDINYQNPQTGQTVIHMAVYHEDNLELLLKSKPDLTLEDNKGMTALEYAKKMGYRKARKILKEHMRGIKD